MLTVGVFLLVIFGLFGGLAGGLLKQLAILFKTLVEDANFGADLLAWLLQQLNQCKDTPTPLCRVFEIIAAVLLGQKIGLNKALYEFVKFLAEKMNIYKPSPQAEELNSAADIRAAQQGEPQQEARMRENTIVIDRALQDRAVMEGFLSSRKIKITVEMQRRVQRASAKAGLLRLKEQIYNDAKSDPERTAATEGVKIAQQQYDAAINDAREEAKDFGNEDTAKDFIDQLQTVTSRE